MENRPHSDPTTHVHGDTGKTERWLMADRQEKPAPDSIEYSVAVRIARSRYGPGLDAGGAHNPRLSEWKLARDIVAQVRRSAEAAPPPDPCCEHESVDGLSPHCWACNLNDGADRHAAPSLLQERDRLDVQHDFAPSHFPCRPCTWRLTQTVRGIGGNVLTVSRFIAANDAATPAAEKADR